MDRSVATLEDIALAFQEIVGTIGMVLWTILCCLAGILVMTLGYYQQFEQIYQKWAEVCLKLANVELIVRGKDRAAKSGAVLVFNHMSLMDVPIVIASVPRIIRFGAKIELFRLPIFGTTLHLSGMVPIPRQNRDEAKKHLFAAIKRAKAGEFIALAPEGTRQTKAGIGEFKLGPFVFAIEGQLPVQPVVIKGAQKTITKSSWFLNMRGNRQIHVEILDPVLTAGTEYSDRNRIKENVRQAMLESYSRLPN